jgi:hemerythrin-like domain-containing protein
LVLSLRGQEVKEYQDPIGILTKEHGDGERYISQLASAADSIRKYGFSADAFAQIADAVLYINTVLRRHNQVEEQYLFPLLEPYASASVSEMRESRKQLWSAFNRLRDIVADIEDGKVFGNSIPDLVDAATYLARYLSVHLADENTVIFPLSRQNLTAKEFAKLAADISSLAQHQANDIHPS